MKIKNLLLFLSLIPMVLSANTLTKNEMKTLGTRAFQQKARFIRPEAAQYELKSCEFLSEDGEVALAVLHFDAGFLILSAEDAVFPVLAYDFENDIQLNDLAPGVEFFLNYYRQGIAAARRVQLPQTEKVRNAWDRLKSEPVCRMRRFSSSATGLQSENQVLIAVGVSSRDRIWMMASHISCREFIAYTSRRNSEYS